MFCRPFPGLAQSLEPHPEAVVWQYIKSDFRVPGTRSGKLSSCIDLSSYCGSSNAIKNPNGLSVFL